MKTGTVTFLSLLAVAAASHAQAPVAPIVVSGADAPMHGILNGKGSATLLLNAGNGAKEAAVTRLVLMAGAEVPEHTHEHSAEILYIEEGSVEMVVGGRAVTARAGDALRIPAGVKHAARVPKAGPALKALQVYVGPGPEQRFTAGPRLNPPPATAR